MQIIFGSGQATGRFAMGSNESLGQPTNLGQGGDAAGRSQPINLDGPEGESSRSRGISNPTDVNVGEQDKGKPPVNLKRKRTCEEEYTTMIGMTAAVQKVATALTTPQHNEVHPELYESVMKTSGFFEEALMFALCYLLRNKAEGLCFV